MRSIILAGCAIAALAAVSSVPVKADQLVSGGVAITHGGGNVNVAKGKFSEADQAVTTLGGIASAPWPRHHQRRRQPQHRSRQEQLRRSGRHHRRRRRLGPWPRADLWRRQPQHRPRVRQHRAAVGDHPGRDGLRARPGADPRRLQHQPCGRQVLRGRSAGPHPRRQRRPGQEPGVRRTQPEQGAGLRLFGLAAGHHRRTVTTTPPGPARAGPAWFL